MVVGLLVLAAVTGIFLAMLNSNNDNLKSMRLNQDLRAAMSLITRNIRRAGVNLDSESLIDTADNDFQGISICDNTPTLLTPPATGGKSIIFFYDDPEKGTSGTIDDEEWFGYRLDNGGIDIGRSDPKAVNPCLMNSWFPATDDTQVNITNLEFSETHIPPSFDGGMPEIQITITISGELVSDTTVKRTISETVYIRNN